MNKNERNLICILIAEWEFSQDTGVSEAVARARCARALQEAFTITNEELSSYRAIEIGKIVNDDSDEFFDLLCDAIDEDYAAVLDALEDGADELRRYLGRSRLSV